MNIIHIRFITSIVIDNGVVLADAHGVAKANCWSSCLIWHRFYTRCPSRHNTPILSGLGTGAALACETPQWESNLGPGRWELFDWLLTCMRIKITGILFPVLNFYINQMLCEPLWQVFLRKKRLVYTMPSSWPSTVNSITVMSVM